MLFRPFSTIIWDQIPFFLGYCEYIESAVFNLIWKRCLTSNFLFLFQQVFKKIFFAILINMGFNLLLPTLIIHIYIITYTYLFQKSESILRKLRKYQIRKMSCNQKWVSVCTNSKPQSPIQLCCEPSRSHMRMGNMNSYNINCP